MRPTQSIILPKSGITAHIITYWSWSEKQEITKAVLGDMTVDVQSQTVSDMKASNAIDLNRKTLELAVKKLEDKEGNEIPVSELFDLPEDDVELVVSKLKEMEESLKKN